MKFYNTERFHRSLDYANSDEMYYAAFMSRKGFVDRLTA